MGAKYTRTILEKKIQSIFAVIILLKLTRIDEKARFDTQLRRFVKLKLILKTLSLHLQSARHNRCYNKTTLIFASLIKIKKKLVQDDIFMRPISKNFIKLGHYM